MSKSTPKSLPNERGQSLVEFAFSITLLLTLLAGSLDLGRAYFTYLTLRDAAQEGAAYGAIDPNHPALIEQRVRTTTSDPLDFSDPNVSVAVGYIDDYYPTGTLCAGDAVQVTVGVTFEIIAPFLGAIVGTQSFPLQATVQDTILRPACP
jgi:Flp pilus assembly protein TadG